MALDNPGPTQLNSNLLQLINQTELVPNNIGPAQLGLQMPQLPRLLQLD